MAGSERASVAVFGAVIGVLATLVTLLALVSQVDAHYVTRREYEATLVSIQSQLTDIKSTVDRQHEITRGR